MGGDDGCIMGSCLRLFSDSRVSKPSCRRTKRGGAVHGGVRRLGQGMPEDDVDPRGSMQVLAGKLRLPHHALVGGDAVARL